MRQYHHQGGPGDHRSCWFRFCRSLGFNWGYYVRGVFFGIAWVGGFDIYMD